MANIAFITDSHIGHNISAQNGVDAKYQWEFVLKAIQTQPIDLVVFGGDIGDISTFEYFFNSLKNLNIPYYNILGNHDQYNEVKPFINHTLATNENEFFYSFEDKQYLYIFLDSSRGMVSHHQLNWVKYTLNQSELTPIIFIHHPILSVSTRLDIDHPLHNRDELVATLSLHNSSINVVTGHYHTESKTSQGNITQYTTPSVAFQILQDTDTVIFDASKFGYRLINLNDNQVDTTVKWFRIV